MAQYGKTRQILCAPVRRHSRQRLMDFARSRPQRPDRRGLGFNRRARRHPGGLADGPRLARPAGFGTGHQWKRTSLDPAKAECKPGLGDLQRVGLGPAWRASAWPLPGADGQKLRQAGQPGDHYRLHAARLARSADPIDVAGHYPDGAAARPALLRKQPGHGSRGRVAAAYRRELPRHHARSARPAGSAPGASRPVEVAARRHRARHRRAGAGQRRLAEALMIRFILRKFGLHTIITLGLLLAAVNCLNAGLGTIIRGATMSAFLPVGTAAALLGWGLASGRFKGWLAWGAIIVLGVLLLTGTTAQLGGPLLELGKLLPSILYQQFLWAREHIPPDFSAAASAWAAVAAQYIGLWERVAHWTQGVLSGGNVYDPVVRVLIWSLLLWPMAAWMGWFLRRRQALIGMAPALVLLALVGDYTRAETWPLWGLLSITLLLMGLTRYETNMARWASRTMDYAEIIQGDTTLAIVLVTTALALAAWVVPSISIRSITDALRERQDGSSNQTVAKALGLEQPPSEPGHFAPYRSPGLPNQHLIGAGPELARIPVMSTSTGELPPGPTDQLARVAPHHHWRSNTFDRYTGSGWASSAVESESYGANVPVFEQSPQGYRVLHQDVIKENTTDGKLYWDGTVLYSADHTFEAGWRIRPAPGSSQSTDPLGGADLLGALSDAKTYQIESLLPTFSVEQLRAAPAVYPDDIVGRYLELPKTVPERVLALARDLTATSPTPYDRAKAIETYLRSTYPYTLDIPAPPAGRDVVDYFLFDLKKGYCDYYATSMVVLARAAGLPARIVIGYATGTYDPYSAVYNITQADAHAW